VGGVPPPGALVARAAPGGGSAGGGHLARPDPGRLRARRRGDALLSPVWRRPGSRRGAARHALSASHLLHSSGGPAMSERPISGSYRPTIMGTHAMVASGHYLATLAGERLPPPRRHAGDARVAGARRLPAPPL